MKWFDSIPFSHSLHDVRALTQSPSQDWNEHIREREEAAYERGRRDGEHALSEQLVRQRSEMSELLNGVIESLRNAAAQVIHQTESALMQLALESAQKIIAGVAITPEMVEAVVKEALRQAEDTAEVVVKLHPDDMALLEKQNASILNNAPGSRPLRFAASAEVSRGGCLVQTRFGVIDARRETKVEQLKEALAR